MEVDRRGDRVTVVLRTPSPLRVLKERLAFEGAARLPSEEARR
jgi:hypothetical protein